MKPGKVLCCRFLFLILGVDRTQNLTKYKRWLRVFIELTNRNIVITYERKTKDVHGHGPSNLNLGLFVCSFDVCRASEPFPSINYE